MSDYTEVFVWGSNQKGQLGLGRNSQQDFVLPRFCSFRTIILAAACGDEHSLFVTKDREVYSMGANSFGQLGLGTDQGSAVPQCVQTLAQVRIVQVACGGAHSFAVSSEGTAYSWGRGDTGALGLGTTDHQSLPRLVRTQPSILINQVSCGARHTAFIGITPDSKGLLLMCGAGEAGQLGTGRRERELIPMQALDLSDVKQVSCGVVHTACVTYSGSVFTMGANNLSQLGIVHKKQSAVPVPVKTLEGTFVEKVACGHHTAALTDRGELYLWGSGTFGQFATPCKVTTIPVALQDLWVAQGFGIGLDTNQKLWSWGSNTSGQLGIGDFQARGTPTPVAALQGKSIQSVACGGSFVLSLGRETIDSSPQSAIISPERSFISPPRSVDVNDYTENEQLRRVIDKMDEENGLLREELTRLREDFETTIEEMQQKADSTVDHVKDLESQLDDQREEREHLASENAELTDRLAVAEEQLSQKDSEMKSLLDDLAHLQSSYEQLHKQNDYLLANLREETADKDRLSGFVKELELEKETLKLKQFGASFITPELLDKARVYKQHSANLLTAGSQPLSPIDLSPRMPGNPVEERKLDRSRLSPVHHRNLATAALTVSDLKDRLKGMSRRPSTQTNP